MKKCKELCVGCLNSIYNRPGYGCWHFLSAKVVERKRVGIDDKPPWNYQPIETMLDCRKERRFVFVDPNREC